MGTGSAKELRRMDIGTVLGCVLALAAAAGLVWVARHAGRLVCAAGSCPVPRAPAAWPAPIKQSASAPHDTDPIVPAAGAPKAAYSPGGGRWKAVNKFGGSEATERAVEAALEWLARHQEPNGSWSAAKWGSSGESAEAVTGLALLAFLGAGYTEKSERFGENIALAEKWLVSRQKSDGSFGPPADHAIAGLALVEAHGMSKDAGLGEAAQKAVDCSVNVMQKLYSGWGREPKGEPDLGITGWFVLQMKSAKIAGLRVPGEAFQGAMAFIDQVTDKGGRAARAPGETPTPEMTAVGIFSRMMMGAPRDEPLVAGGASHLAENLPRGDGAALATDWHFGSLGMFQAGGENWSKWNAALKPALLDGQHQGGSRDGSATDWDGSWDKVGTQGRAAATALGALCLETYYRYLPMAAR